MAAALHLDIGLWDRSDLQMRLLGLVLWFCSKDGSLGSVCLGPCQGSWLLAADTGPGGAIFPLGAFWALKSASCESPSCSSKGQRDVSGSHCELALPSISLSNLLENCVNICRKPFCLAPCPRRPPSVVPRRCFPSSAALFMVSARRGGPLALLGRRRCGEKSVQRGRACAVLVPLVSRLLLTKGGKKKKRLLSEREESEEAESEGPRFVLG